MAQRLKIELDGFNILYLKEKPPVLEVKTGDSVVFRYHIKDPEYVL